MDTDTNSPPAGKLLRFRQVVSLGICSFLFTSVGVLHFVKPLIFVRIMPPQIPFALELVYLSGFFEVVGGLGLVWKRTRYVSVMLLLALLILVFPANIHMALNADRFSEIPAWLLAMRLPLQAVIGMWVWSCRD